VILAGFALLLIGFIPAALLSWLLYPAAFRHMVGGPAPARAG
jgi:hypothetical protein